VALVILTTLLTVQHHLIDPVGGLTLGWAGIRFGLWAEYGMKINQQVGAREFFIILVFHHVFPQHLHAWQVSALGGEMLF
jgi:hypothetical protein